MGLGHGPYTTKHSNVKQGLVVGDVVGRDALIFEDEIAAGSTIVSTVETLTRAGARSVTAAATHGVLCGPAIERLNQCPVKEIVVTNTVDVSPSKRLNKIKVLSTASLFAEAIKRIHSGESVGALFT